MSDVKPNQVGIDNTGIQNEDEDVEPILRGNDTQVTD